MKITLAFEKVWNGEQAAKERAAMYAFALRHRNGGREVIPKLEKEDDYSLIYSFEVEG